MGLQVLGAASQHLLHDGQHERYRRHASGQGNDIGPTAGCGRQGTPERTESMRAHASLERLERQRGFGLSNKHVRGNMFPGTNSGRQCRQRQACHFLEVKRVCMHPGCWAACNVAWYSFHLTVCLERTSEVHKHLHENLFQDEYRVIRTLTWPGGSEQLLRVSEPPGIVMICRVTVTAHWSAWRWCYWWWADIDHAAATSAVCAEGNPSCR